MSGASNDDCGSDDRSSSLEEVSSDQRCQSGELTEWRSCEQVENGTPSTSPPYWDTDDDDDTGPKPSELYGKFTWKIENFTQISKRELRSNAFEVGGYKWYILIYPQGCDVCNHLSLFLCVANHDKLLPGWSHFAQFTIAVVNKDPKKSKYSDTLHRFWKKEHDWGWKKFMELSKVLDGFIVADALVIKAQVQVIREKTHRPFRCLDCQYRRELVRVYLSNVELICRKFVEERRSKLSKLIEDKVRWSSFCDFWSGVDKGSRLLMSSDKTEAILKVVVKHFFIEKEVTSTLVMDSLYSGLKALESQSKNNKGRGISAVLEEMLVPMVYIEKDMFVLSDDALVLLERAAIEPMPPKEDKGSQNQSTNLNRTKDGNSSEEFNKDSIERDERRLTELGRRTVEIFVLAHIFSSRIEVAYQEAVALKRQEELIREEEAAWQAEELRAKRGATEKEKKSKKKQTKQKRSNRKGKDKARDEKPDLVVLNRQDKSQRHGPSVERLSECYLLKEVETVIEKIEITEDVSDVSDTLDDAVEALQHDLEDRDGSPRNWDTEESEVTPATEASSSEVQSEKMEKMNPSIVDDSSSTCSTDSVPSFGINGQHIGNSLQINKGSRGRYRRGQVTRDQTSQIQDADNVRSENTAESNFSQDSANISGASPPDSGDVLSDHIQYVEQNLVEKEKEVVPLQKNLGDKNQVESERSTKQSVVEEISAATSLLRSHTSSHQMTCPRDPSSNNNHANRLVSGVTKSVQAVSVLKPEMQVSTATVKVIGTQQASPVSRPLSAPLIPGPRPTTPLVSTVQTMPLLLQTMPLLLRSVSAAGRLGTNETSTHGYAPQSYRNAIIGKSTMGPNSAGIVPRVSIGSSTQSGTHSQPSTPSLPSSTTSLQISPSTDKNSARSGFSFRPVIQEASSSGNRWTEHSSVQDGSSSGVSRSSDIIHDTARLNLQNVSLRHTEIGSGSSVRLTQGANSYEFPHLDLINYLLDEDQVTEKASENGQNQHLMSRQFTFPGSSGNLDLGISNGSNRFDAQYYDETMQRALYGSPSGHFDARIDLMQPQLDASIYANGQMDGLLLNQWPSGGIDHSMHSMDPADIHRYSYQIPDYSGLSRGFNGYGFYRPANGR